MKTPCGPVGLGRRVAVLPVAVTVLWASTTAAQPPATSPLTFESALDLAASRNLTLAAARRQRAIREAAVRAARQRPNPELAFETSRDIPHQTLSLDVPLELGGRRSRRIDLAREELTLADVDVRAGLRTVRRDIRRSFYSLVAAADRVAQNESILDIARRVRDAAELRFETGAAPRLEVLQADLGVTRAEIDLDAARGARVAAQAELNAVLDLPPTQPVDVVGRLSDHVSPVTYDLTLSLALTSNIDLITLDRQIAIEQRRVDLLRAERTPTPIFSVGALFNAPDEFDVGHRAGFSVTLPLFTRNQGEIAGSISTAAQLRAARDAMRRTIENDVFATVARIEAERRLVEAYDRRLVPTATDLELLAEESYRAGRTSVLGVLEAQRSLRDLSRDALQAALDLQLSLADLEELIGAPLP